MKQIIAMGGGGFLMDETPLLDDFILSRARGSDSRVCFLATAAGDSDRMLVSFYTAFGPRSRASHLALFRREVVDIPAYLLEQDVIYVGGGNTANLLAIWRLHGVDEGLRRAYEAGVLLCGLSAGALCWFESGVTDSFGLLSRFDGALGVLPGSFSPHYDSDSRRRPIYQRLIAEGMLPGFAADDGAALHFVDGALAEVVTSRPHAAAYQVERRGEAAHEEKLRARYLGSST